jgi:hypothetical protein
VVSSSRHLRRQNRAVERYLVAAFIAIASTDTSETVQPSLLVHQSRLEWVAIWQTMFHRTPKSDSMAIYLLGSARR